MRRVIAIMFVLCLFMAGQAMAANQDNFPDGSSYSQEEQVTSWDGDFNVLSISANAVTVAIPLSPSQRGHGDWEVSARQWYVEDGVLATKASIKRLFSCFSSSVSCTP